MNVELARTFLEIVSTGNFVRAADRLHVTQTTVSARVRLLEEQLGRPLFVRNRAGARLTAAGEQFLRHAQALVQVWERARQEVAVPPGHSTVVTVGCEPSLWSPLLVDWLRWMRRTGPDLAVRALVAPADQLQDQVLEGILDIAVLYAPRYQTGLAVELLLEERLVLVTTEPAESSRGPNGGPAGRDYVHVDWGAQFAVQYALRYPQRPEPSVFVGHGPLGLQYILEAGGSGYFRLGVVRPLLEAGRLTAVRDAPEFVYPAYAVYAERGERAVVRTALEGLRAASGGGRPGAARVGRDEV